MGKNKNKPTTGIPQENIVPKVTKKDAPKEEQGTNLIISLKPEIANDPDLALLCAIRAIIVGFKASKAQKLRALEYFVSELKEEN